MSGRIIMWNYFAYGSNLHPFRLEQRIGAVGDGIAATLPGATMQFNKIGRDGSGKCNLQWTDSLPDRVVGVVYQVTDEQRELLNSWEGESCGYYLVDVDVDMDQSPINAFTYIAPSGFIDPVLKPFDWYRELVYLGAMHYRFPVAYLKALTRQAVITDPNEKRDALHQKLIAEIREQLPVARSSY